jgi:glyoxylase-like metal-dependent hydrolase (beta-lactamase superfamily II)
MKPDARSIIKKVTTMNEQNREIETAQSTAAVFETRVDRRNFLRLGGAGAVMGLTVMGAAPSRAQDATTPVVPESPLPVVDARFPARIADGIWILPDQRTRFVPNIGIIEGDTTVLVIDSGFTAQSGRDVLKAARAIAGQRDIVLTVTHAHPEHTFGAQAFKGQARIYYNKLQRDYLARDGAKLLRGFRSLLTPDRVSLLDDIRITLADKVYEGSTEVLDLGNRRVEFRTWGIAHSPGDQIIHIPDQKVTFAGDLIEERIFPIVPLFPPMILASDMNLGAWQTALSDIAAQQPRIIVPGHGNLGGVELARTVSSYFGELRGLVAGAKARKATDAAAMRHLAAQVQRSHPTWELSEFIAPALRYFVERT